MAAAAAAASLSFRVTRQSPELITPAKPTPYEYKLLSDIDDQESLRFRIPVIFFYKKDNDLVNVTKRDPVKVIKEALSKTLVYYYPFAGRLREGVHRKLGVECTGEGVMFTEADADVTIEEFGDPVQPPFPCLEQLLYDVPGFSGVLHCPLLLIQVTRLKCGGFIFAVRLNHTMSDGTGLLQFLNALADIARGASAPSVLPVWQRELLNARNPPRVTCTHHEYDDVPDTKGTITPLDKMVHRSFFFGPAEILALRQLVPPHLRNSSTFEVLTACLWRCRTSALQLHPEDDVRLLCNINARSKFVNPPLPKGYYGNAFAFPAALTTAGKLCQNPIGYALELVKKLKEEVTEEYMRSVADLMVLKGRPPTAVARIFHVSAVTRTGLAHVDFGWGKPAYSGPARGGTGNRPVAATYYVSCKNKNGENGIMALITLPAYAMENFAVEVDGMLKNNDQIMVNDSTSLHTKSAL